MDKSLMKKIGLIVVLVVIIGAIIFVARNASSGKKEEKTASTNTSLGNKTATEENEVKVEQVSVQGKAAKVEELSDGTLYTVADGDVNADIVIGDNYFDTQLADINTNFSQYEGKTIEIEGLYLKNLDYTFVGRYSNSNLCSYCPAGYSYFEYEWKGDQKPELAEEDSWLKVKGTLTRGNDAGTEYYYIDVASLEVMNEKGVDTVNN